MLTILLLALACNTDKPGDDTAPTGDSDTTGETGDSDTTGETGDTDTTGETGDTGGAGPVTLTWNLRPDAGLAAPDAAALRLGDGAWEAIDVEGEWAVDDPQQRYQLVMACVPTFGEPSIFLIDATPEELPAPRLACPWLDSESQIAVSLRVEDLSDGETALATIGSEALMATTLMPSGNLSPVAGSLDTSLAMTAVIPSGRSTFALGVEREQTIKAGVIAMSTLGLADTIQETLVSPPLTVNGEAVSTATTISLWTAGGTLAELGWSFNNKLSWGAPPKALVEEGDMLLVLAQDDGEHGRFMSVGPPGAKLAYDGVDGECSVAVSGTKDGLKLEGSAVSPGDGWFFTFEARSSVGVSSSWRVFTQPDRSNDTASIVLPNPTDIPGFDAAWDPADFTTVRGGIFAVSMGGEAAPPMRAFPEALSAAILWRIAGTGSGLVGPLRLLGLSEPLTVVELTTLPAIK